MRDDHDDVTRYYGGGRTLPMQRAYTTVEAAEARERARRLGACLGIYGAYDDAIAIYRRVPERADGDSTLGGLFPPLRPEEREDFMWDTVGALLLAEHHPRAGVTTLFAIEVEEGFERRDVERHIGLLFPSDATGATNREGHDDETSPADPTATRRPARRRARRWLAQRLGRSDTRL